MPRYTITITETVEHTVSVPFEGTREELADLEDDELVGLLDEHAPGWERSGKVEHRQVLDIEEEPC